MSVVYSLLIYNPLEALLLILFCDIFTNRSFKKIDILHCYILGIINLFLQYYRMYINSTIIMLVYDILVALLFMSFILYYYYNNFINKRSQNKVNLSSCFLSTAMNFITICIVVNIYNNIFDTVFNSVYVSEYYEFLSNITMKILQFSIVNIIKYGVNKHEKRIKKNLD